LINTCASGQVLAWSGSSWVCSTIGTPAGTTNGIAVFSSPSQVTSTAAPTNGQLLIGSTGKAPALATLTAGSNVSITNSAGQITISSSGASPTLPFFATGGGILGTARVAGLTNVNTVWGFLLPYNVATTKISYTVAVADNTANSYDIGIFNNSGALIVDLGPTPGTKFAPTAGLRTLNWVQGSANLAPGRYYLGLTTNCSTSCAQFSVSNAFVSYAADAAGGVTTGGALPSIMSIPPDTWKASTQPVVVIR
jgi:hypothetical protein